MEDDVIPHSGNLALQRQRIKRLIMELEREHPAVKSSMITFANASASQAAVKPSTSQTD